MLITMPSSCRTLLLCQKPYLTMLSSAMHGLQKRMRSVLPETEQEASIAYDLKRPVVSSVVNERSQNKWGTPQGYRIQVWQNHLSMHHRHPS